MANEVLSIDIFEKHYELPKDIITYIEEHHRFEVYRQQLLAYFMKNFCDYQKFPSDAERISYEKFRHYGNLCVQRLIASDIYNATIDDLVGSIPKMYTWKFCMEASINDGVKLFYESLFEAVSEWGNAYLEQATSFLNQAQQAEYNRDSKITGTGFGIITNDIIGFGVWAAMENSAIKKQASAANAEFRNEIDAISRNLENNSRVRLDKYGKDVWLPSLKNSIDLFVISLFNKYMEILISNGKFNPDALKYIDIAKSQSILQNIETTSNKLGILDAAFLSCPFNPEIYDIAIGICNVEEIVNCARIFGADESLKLKFSDTCNKIATNPNYSEAEIVEKIVPYISMVALLSGKAPEAVQDEALNAHRSLVKDKIYKIASKLQSTSESEIKAFIRSITTTRIDELVGVSDVELRELITLRVIGEVFKKDKPEAYERIISQTVEKIESVVRNYLSKVSRAKADYSSKKNEYDKYSLSADEEIRSLNEQLSSLGIFSFSKKKELNAKITDIQGRIGELKRAFEVAEKAYRNLI